ncbi:hypothetical protein BGZ99_006454 [Dissophora globulifera]|uniref:Uncharacterized protein n=1 Tax=Dissophora globulifera TaxID=979702 RepID=A0A9P6RGB5_9FUNG|nr:hypothetical protein BGZ99_006454 [Dissophora globulifera]
MLTLIKLETANVVDQGFCIDLIKFDNAQSSSSLGTGRLQGAKDDRLQGAKDDSEDYRRGGYANVASLPLGPEFTFTAPTSGTNPNGMLEGCNGNCSTHWNLGFDHGLAALAGVKIESGLASCAMPLIVTGRSEDKISNEILRLCNGRCANAIYNTTIALSKRTEPPGVRTFVGLLTNWGSWVSCSMYDALSQWIVGKGEGFAWADTLHTSRIHFVDAPLCHLGRPHNPKLLAKRSGWDDEGSPAWVEACKRYGLRGVQMRQSLGMGNLVYSLGIHGNSPMARSCVVIDTLGFADYNIFSNNSPCKGYHDFAENYCRNAIHGSLAPQASIEQRYIGSYAMASQFSFGFIQVKQRLEHNLGKTHMVRRGGAVWEDKELWSSFMLVDCGVIQGGAMGGGCGEDMVHRMMCRVLNDVIDLGYDWSSGDLSNSILTLSKGKTDRDSFASAYTKIAAVINYASVKNPDSSGSILIAHAHAWQISDSRHPVIACSLVSNDPGLGPTNVTATWHHVGILGLKPTKLVDHNMQEGELHGKHVNLTKRTWDMLAKDSTGFAAKVLYYGHVWLLEQRAIGRVPTADEIAEVEDSLRVALLTVMMEFARADAVEAIWCWTIESWCASDMMWHAMIGSTAYFSTRKVGSDRVDDKNVLQSWTEA